ncbi:MAG: MarR family transcriptional regulator [Candidatus Marsarchaeota archaeon]|nr:MarR family transcriptional regulator [Candidatus Marsarchaeota archaeon]
MTQRTFSSTDAWRTLSDTAKKMVKAVGLEVSKAGVTLVEVKMMRLLEQEGRIPMTRIALELMMTPAGATMVADRLERRGFVRRVRSSDDRRMVYVELTRRGSDRLRLATGLHNSYMERLFGGLTQSEVKSLTEILSKIDGLIDSV